MIYSFVYHVTFANAIFIALIHYLKLGHKHSNKVENHKNNHV